MTNAPFPPRSNLNVIELCVIFLILINVVVAKSVTVLVEPNFCPLWTFERHVVNETQHFMSLQVDKDCKRKKMIVKIDVEVKLKTKAHLE